MGENHNPRILLLEHNEDAASVLAGTLYLKGCQVHKTNRLDRCLKTLNELQGQVDVVVINHESVGREDMSLIFSIKKINSDTKILFVTSEQTSRATIIDFGADDVALKPMSPENMADKILMLMAKEATISNKEKDR